MTAKEQFIAWLNDARSTELAQIPVLENHANDAKDYPHIYERDMQHLAETKRQAELVEQMILDLGGSISTVKTIIGKIAGLGHSVSTEIFPDELIKNFLADYASENFEIASYTSLIATAELIGEEQCIPILEEILAEEIRMAEWLEENIAFATDESLKAVAGEDYRQYPEQYSEQYQEQSPRRSYKSAKPGLTARITKPSTLAALIGIGAVGAGAAYLLRSDSGKQSVQNFLERAKQRRLSRRTENTAVNNDSPALPETVTVIETITLTVDDADDSSAQAPFSSSVTNS